MITYIPWVLNRQYDPIFGPNPTWSKGCVGCGNICAPIKGNCGKGATSCAVAGKASIKSPRGRGSNAT